MLLYLLLVLGLVEEGICMHRPQNTPSCLTVKMNAYCYNKSLQQVPLDLPPDIQTLDLSNNEIENITEDPLMIYSFLENLDLSSNQLSFIQPHSFKEMHKLKEINLSGNNLDSFVHYGVSGIGLLPYVQTLDLSRNSLYNDMTGYFIQEAPQLRYISLYENSITTISSDMFQGSPLLVEVNLHNNIIMDIEEGAFEHLKHLSMINLSMNSITCISDFNLHQLKVLDLRKNSIKTFHTPESDEEYLLENLDLSHNKLSSFPQLPRINNLIIIDLSKNYIHLGTELSGEDPDWMNYSFQLEFGEQNPQNISTVHLPKLTHLDLSYNNIKSIPDDFFLTMPALTFLNLSKNCIQVLSLGHFSGLNSLVTLDLSANSIQNLSLSTNSLLSLQELYLHHNQIHLLEPRIFQRLESIVMLHLQGNRVAPCMADLGEAKRRTHVEEYRCVEFFNIPTLQHLNLRENMIQRVPHSAFWGTSLKVLDLSMNLGVKMKPNALSGLEETLEVLSMEGNGLPSLNVDFPFFTHLKYLNLSGNQLSVLPEWNGNCHLETLDLSHNSFTDLEVSNIQVLENTLKTLSLYGNPLSCCANTWISHMIQRTTVTFTALNATTCNVSKLYEGEILVEQMNPDICEKDWKKVNVIVTLVLVLLVVAIGISFFFCFCRNRLNRKYKA
ncbi:transforming growth factor beta activator LRRC32 [Xenopus laevis]|uniref:Transforming growth factor beta activator LRRC32 n=1 Tax=Xenopus laevis TaxID=8355 RepID=A0A8J1MCD2_XENLA|nr:transforming growth factor beta activator LRRC32 [Xenopus laevis]XP_041438744.1 transforming growth factor beta activator LRRC32 [Xenopus laevis]XP_041438745.1 transforming growth factor beta activator LRRC32 [Xenopus laevis]